MAYTISSIQYTYNDEQSNSAAYRLDEKNTDSQMTRSAHSECMILLWGVAPVTTYAHIPHNAMVKIRAAIGI